MKASSTVTKKDSMTLLRIIALVAALLASAACNAADDGATRAARAGEAPSTSRPVTGASRST
jgi:hypothetical protein